MYAYPPDRVDQQPHPLFPEREVFGPSFCEKAVVAVVSRSRHVRTVVTPFHHLRASRLPRHPSRTGDRSLAVPEHLPHRRRETRRRRRANERRTRRRRRRSDRLVRPSHRLVTLASPLDLAAILDRARPFRRPFRLPFPFRTSLSSDAFGVLSLDRRQRLFHAPGRVRRFRRRRRWNPSSRRRRFCRRFGCRL